MKVFTGSRTDLGQRSNNEDSYAIVDVARQKISADGILIVADGMGGRNFGEMASRVAVETIEETLSDVLGTGRAQTVPVADALDSALRKANARVYEIAQEDPAYKDMGTTCVTVVIANNKITIAHVGDSRAYLLRENVLEQVTDDHSLVAEQVKAGALTKAGALKSRFRNVITRAVGIEPAISPDVATFDLGDVRGILVCTDGLTNMVRDEDIAQVMAFAPTAQEAADLLVSAAVRNGGSDNITAVVARLGIDAPLESEEDPATNPPTMAMQSPQVAKTASVTNWVLPALLTFLVLCFIGTTVFLSSQLTHDGYKFQASSPFIVKPPLPAPPQNINLDLVSYEAPTLFYTVPVRGTTLVRSGADGSLNVLTLNGQMVTLTADGKTKAKIVLPTHLEVEKLKTETEASASSLHFAADSQGNLYISNPTAGTITKIRSSGKGTTIIGRGNLVQPEALAVSDNGTIYVIDAQRLKVLHVRPANK